MKKWPEIIRLQHSCAGRCELEHGPAIAAETARRLACDASLISIIENERGEPLNVGRKSRTIPPAIRRALNSRDKGCRFPGGETKLSNLVTLCRFHHRQVHEGKVEVQILDDGAFRFVPPDGQSFVSAAPIGTEWTRLVAAHDASEIVITPETARTRWTGESLDDALAVEWPIQRAKRAKNVPAGTSL